MSEGADLFSPPSAAIVSVGDELLLGETVDTNGSWLAQEISHLGFRVLRRWVVGDIPSEIREVVQGALEVAEVVLVTGGLGPTPDDLTREAVAGLLGFPLETDPDLLDGLKARFRARGYGELPEGSRAMADVPQGGIVLPNSHGAAPGLAMENREGKLCILLPGVPREMKGIVGDEVGPFLRKRYSTRLRPAVHRVVHTFGVPESVLASEIRGLLPSDLGGVSLAYLPDLLGVRLRLTVRESEGPADAEASLRRVEELLDPVLSRYRYEAKTGDLTEAVGAALLRTGHTLAIAESCTGGLVCKRVTDLPGSSRYFLGGVVAYADEVKAGVLGVGRELIRRNGVVSEAVAEAMAVGVARELEASVGVGVTGIAGPGGGSPGKPVGTVCYAISLCGKVQGRRELFLGNREAVRERAAHAVLGLLLRLLDGREG
ncbi:MAG: CinA family nicotinamide mononucleotide deamidase-related protein [Gemmatimonadota bacterium]